MHRALPGPLTAPARILIVDDSAVARAAIGRIVEESGRCAVAGSVSTANAALAFLRRDPVDVILLDLEMPGVDGLTALPDLIAAGGGAKVLIVSSSADDGAAATIQALALGAADTLVKPGAGGLAGRFGDMLVDRITRLLAPADPSTPVSAAPPTLATQLPAASAEPFAIVAIGASTGGIHALSGLLRAVPASFRLPILITQHLPATFMPYFAAQMAVLAGRPCDVATDLMRIRPGRVVVAPGDAHLCCVALPDGAAAVRLSRKPAASGCLPSVDPMFDTLAAVYGARILAVVLSGMGRDGAEGARRVAEAGGSVVIQDRESSVVWGMPGAVAATGVAHAALPPEAIGALVASRRRPQ